MHLYLQYTGYISRQFIRLSSLATSCELALVPHDPGQTREHPPGELEPRFQSVLVATSNPNNRDHPLQPDNSDLENDN
jgi:hypothetical protein